MILFQRWRIVVSVLGLIALTAFLAPPREMPEVKPEVNPYNDYLSSAIFVSGAEAQPDEVYSCNEECDPDEGGGGSTCQPVSEAVYCGMQLFFEWYWDIMDFGWRPVTECDSFMADEDDPYCQPTNP